MNTELSEHDAAWFAGFLDGEGCFQIRRQRSKRDRHCTSTVASVHVSQAEPRTAILYWIKENFGGVVVSNGRSKPTHNNAFSWAVTGARAVHVCKTVLPYLKLKRRHAELILEHQATKLPSHIGCRLGMSPKSVRIPPEMIILRNAHIAEMHVLNKRGIAAEPHQAMA